MHRILWLLSFLAATAVAQTPASTAPSPSPLVTLKITAKGTGVPVAKAEIRVGSETAFSDKNGVAKIAVPPIGDGVVTVTRKGFERVELQFNELRPPGDYDVRLFPGDPDDDVIIVRGKRNSSVSRKTVSIDEAARIAPGGDPAQVVKLLPGVQSAGGGRGGGGGGRGGGGGGGAQIVVQGSGPHDSRYFIDDLEVPFIFHGFDNLSVIPGDMLSAVDFESAGFGAEYGDATGGIVTLRTKNDVPERAKTTLTLNLPFYSGVLYTAPLSEETSITVGIRRSYIDFFLQRFLNRQNRRAGDKSTAVTIAPYFSDAEAQYLKKEDDGHLKVTLLGAYDGIKAVVPTGRSSDGSGLSSINFLTTFADLGVEKEKILDKNWKYVATPQIYYYKSTATFGDFNAENSTEKVRVPTSFTRKLDKGENLYVGLDPDFTLADTSIFAPQFQSADPTYDPEDAPLIKSVDKERYANLATWVAVDQAIGPVTVTPGARAEYDGQTKKSVVDPRLRARYALTDEHSLKGAIGQYSESPQPLQASAERGNPNLGFMRAYHYVLGLETAWSETWNTDLSLYYKTARDMVESDADTKYANKGAMRSRGFLAMIRRNPTGRFFGWLSYTYSKTEEKPEPAKTWRTATYDQTHVLVLVGDYKITGTWDFGGRYDYHTGNTYNTVDGAVFNANLDKYSPRTSDQNINAGRTPPYNSLTAYFTHDFLYDTWKLAMRFGLEQYWFRPQVSNVSYNYNYSERVSAAALTTIPFFELKGEL